MSRGYLDVIEQDGFDDYEQRTFGFSTPEDAEQAQILLQVQVKMLSQVQILLRVQEQM